MKEVPKKWCLFLLLMVIIGIAHEVHSHQNTFRIGLLVDLHDEPQHMNHESEVSIFEEVDCSSGHLNPTSAQHVLAARWAVGVINNQSKQQGLKLSLQVFDSCGSRDVAMRDIFFAVKDSLDPLENQPLIGVIGVGDPEVVSETVTTLHAFNIPLILASPRLAQMLAAQQTNILSTAPHLSSVVKPILAIAKQLTVSTISLISSCKQSIEEFSHAAQEQGIFMGRILELNKHKNAFDEIVQNFLEESVPNETIALILEPEELNSLAQFLRSINKKKITVIIGSIGLNKNIIQLWSNIFDEVYLVEPHMPELPDFRNFLLEELQNAKKSNDSLIREYIEKVYDCEWATGSFFEKANLTSCDSLGLYQFGNKLQIDPELTFIVKAVSAFSAAILLVEAERCKNVSDEDCYEDHSTRLQQDVLSMLSHLSFTSRQKTPFNLQGATLQMNHNGQLIANKYAIYYIDQGGNLLGVGWYSDDQGFVIDHNTETTIAKSRQLSTPTSGHRRGFISDQNLESSNNPKLTTSQQLFKDPPIISSFDSDHKSGVHRSIIDRRINIGDEGSVNAKKVTPESYITRTWATVMVAIAAIGTIITLFMIVYVLMKICDGTLSGNQSLGVFLLIGIMIIYGSVVLFVLPGSPIRCNLRVFLHPIALSLCYGILIIKVMQLRSLVLLGLGGRISYINQYIILFFIVLVEIVIIIQWVLTNKPHFRIDSQGLPYCYMPQSDFLLLHLYPVILVIIAFLYGVTVLKIRRNYKEGRWVTLAALLSMPVMALWGLVTCLIPEQYGEPTVCVSLVILATILVTAIFIPKMNTIAKQNSHFKHKKIQVADSVTTIFTTFTDINSAGGRKKLVRNPHYMQQFHAKMADAYSDNITKNPIYEVTNGGAYP